MNINDEKKIEILLLALKERYDSIHKIRERVQGIGIWTLGALLVAGGWIIQSPIALTGTQKTSVIVGIVIAFCILRFVYFEDLRMGFCSQQRVAVQIEKVLGLFTPGNFSNSTESIYPKNWKKTGTGEGDGNFFYSTYILICTGVIFFIAAVLLNT